jgi:raffinose/stachyose/melibiose transport system permease protein
MHRKYTPYLLIAPLILIQLLIVVLPALLNIGSAFTEWNGLSDPIYVGLENFKNLFSDKTFQLAFKHNAQWTCFYLTVPVLMALVGAVMASKIRTGQILFRVIYSIPYVVAAVVTCQMWRYIINPIHGIGPQLERIFGWEWASISLLGNREFVLWTIAGINNWHWWGFVMILYLSAMQSIPPDLFDAAKVDGASGWQEFIHIIIPGIRPTLVYSLIMTASASFLTFDYVWILTQGGPAHGSELLSTYMYTTGFIKYDVGYSSAIALGMTLMAGSFSLLFYILNKLGWEI